MFIYLKEKVDFVFTRNVYHHLKNIDEKIDNEDEHMCEVELLSALGKKQVCCNHTHE